MDSRIKQIALGVKEVLEKLFKVKAKIVEENIDGYDIEFKTYKHSYVVFMIGESGEEDKVNYNFYNEEGLFARDWIPFNINEMSVEDRITELAHQCFRYYCDERLDDITQWLDPHTLDLIKTAKNNKIELYDVQDCLNLTKPVLVEWLQSLDDYSVLNTITDDLIKCIIVASGGDTKVSYIIENLKLISKKYIISREELIKRLDPIIHEINSKNYRTVSRSYTGLKEKTVQYSYLIVDIDLAN